jgi:hypothetical protein
MKANQHFILLLLLFLSLTTFAQDYDDFHLQSLQQNRSGMLLLGSWAVANIGIGAYEWSQNTGSKMYFNQMNVFWNVVNLGIAGFGYYNSSLFAADPLNQGQALVEHVKMENILLINAGLDILYMGTGFYLNHLSKGNSKRPQKLKGYGNSLILQGGFLFGFDAVMYLVKRSSRINSDMLDSFYFNGNSLGFVLSF